MPSFADALSVEQRWDLADTSTRSRPPTRRATRRCVATGRARARPRARARSSSATKIRLLPGDRQINAARARYHPSVTGSPSAPSTTTPTSASSSAGTTCGRRTPAKSGPSCGAGERDEGDKEAAKPARRPAAAKEWGEAEAPAAKPAAAEGADVWGEAAESAGGAEEQFSTRRDPVRSTSRRPSAALLPLRRQGNPVDSGSPISARKRRGSTSAAAATASSRSARAAQHDEPLREGEWTVIFKRKLRAQGETSLAKRDFIADRVLGLGRRSRERGNKRGPPAGTVYSRRTSSIPRRRHGHVGDRHVRARARVRRWARRRRKNSTT